jgi:hypothetical protein
MSKQTVELSLSERCDRYLTRRLKGICRSLGRLHGIPPDRRTSYVRGQLIYHEEERQCLEFLIAILRSNCGAPRP